MQRFPKQYKLLEQLLTKLTDLAVGKILVCAVATVRFHTTQVCHCVFDADRKRGGKSYHLTEKQLLCHFTRRFQTGVKTYLSNTVTVTTMLGL